jgi:PAS domain S-box-containing protein
VETGRSRPRWDISHPISSLQTVFLVWLVATLCYLAAKLGGVLIITVPQTLWPLWPGCAVLVAILLLCPRRMWPILLAVGLAGFVAYDLQAGVPILSIVWLILSDILEILVAALGVTYALKGLPRLDSLNALLRYSFFTVILASFLAASIGSYSLKGDRWISWRISLLSEGLAFLTVTPAILGWVGRSRAVGRAPRAYYLEASVLAAALISLCYFMFVTRGTSAPPALLYSLIPFLLWSALRFGLKGASTSASIVALLSIWGAVHGRGPFTESDPINRVFSLQLFLLFTATPFMVLAVLAEERQRAEEELRNSGERLRLAAQAGKMLAYEWDASTDVIVLSPQSHQLLGKSVATQTSGRRVFAKCHPDDRGRLAAASAKLRPEKPYLEVTYRTILPNGTVRWVEANGHAFFDQRGKMLRIIGMAADITARKEDERELEELGGRLIRAQEDERARIARDLHDNLGQRMALLQIGVERLELDTAKPASKLRQELNKIAELAGECSSGLHDIVHELHPSKLDLLGLASNLRSLCTEFSVQHDMQVQFVHQGSSEELPMEVNLCLFRIAQEALTNVVKHSGAKDARVELHHHDDQIDLCIADPGEGFDPTSATGRSGLGLISIRERLRLIGGHLSIESDKSHGTRIRARIPLSGTARQATSDAKV